MGEGEVPAPYWQSNKALHSINNAVRVVCCQCQHFALDSYPILLVLM